jgi:hypothetical protein
MMLFSIWGGSLADLYPKRSIIVATQTAQMVCAFLLAVGAWTGFATPLFIIIITALNGVAMGFDMPARQAFTVEMTSREDLLNAISLNSSNRERRACCRSVDCWFDDCCSRCRHVFFPERRNLCRGDCRFVDDALAAI